MRILVQMPFPGFLRNYGSTIRLLADRGHEVLLSYDYPDKRRDLSAVLTESHERVQIVSPIPHAKRRNERAIAQLRAAIDYLRYLDKRFAGSPYLRHRFEKYLHWRPLRLLARAPYGMPFARTGLRALIAVERLVPSDPRVERAIASYAPDAIFITPLIGRSKRNRRQTDTVKAARKLGIPIGAGVATWDQLTTKGIVKVMPDRLFVWNEQQRIDAEAFHFVPPERVIVTGAQLFDWWFEHRPRTTREEFLELVGLGTDRPYVLYVGSSPNIAPSELEIPFVRRWIESLRSYEDPAVASLGVLVRPHPYSVIDWSDVDLADLGAAVTPRRPPELPMSPADEALYFDSINFSEAVVGINTTAMVEAFIRRRPVLTIRAPEFKETQGTLHFGNLSSAAGRSLQTATTFEGHLVQLRMTLNEPEHAREGIDSFLLKFVRPCGLDQPATPIIADAIEQLGADSAFVRKPFGLRSRSPHAEAGAQGLQLREDRHPAVDRG